MYELRPYQHEAVQKTIEHFRQSKQPAVIVLPTGAGKSIVISEISKIAKGRVLVLAHVKELVEQNHDKFKAYGLNAGIYSAGLNQKDSNNKVIFASIQSVANAKKEFFDNFSIVIIDECHRISIQADTQYLKVINELKNQNENLCILGLTATPYRLGLGWIYEFHYSGKVRTNETRFFKKCIFELSISYMIKNKYLTQPVQIDSPVISYNFSSLKINQHRFKIQDIENCLKDQSRITPRIIANIIDITEKEERKGVMIFTSTVRHAKEILKLLPQKCSAIVTGDTEIKERDHIVQQFKDQELKYLVNVSVLTTGFDAPHVDIIAILRPTESVSLYQQIVGRGLRLSPGKTDCLILDYTGQDHNIFSPEISENKPSDESVPVEIPCPQCGIINEFWGIKDAEGNITEHFGRKCQGASENPKTKTLDHCGYRFRFKICDKCNSENDIAARSCTSCDNILVDNDKKLKEAMSLKDAHILKPDTMTFEKSYDKKGNERLEIRYYDYDAEYLKEFFYLNNTSEQKAFYYNFIRMHNKLPERKLYFKSAKDVIENQNKFRMPQFIIARKNKKFWSIRDKIF